MCDVMGFRYGLQSLLDCHQGILLLQSHGWGQIWPMVSHHPALDGDCFPATLNSSFSAAKEVQECLNVAMTDAQMASLYGDLLPSFGPSLRPTLASPQKETKVRDFYSVPVRWYPATRG